MMKLNLKSWPDDAIELSRKSWVAYVFTLLVFLAGGILARLAGYHSAALGWTASVFVLMLVCVDVMSLSSIGLYSNSDGGWVESGFLPMTRRVVLIRWRDLQSATVDTGLLSALLGAHTVRIGHRIKARGAVLTHMRGGRAAVLAINRHYYAVQAAQSQDRTATPECA
jgi:hypothetical protein